MLPRLQLHDLKMTPGRFVDWEASRNRTSGLNFRMVRQPSRQQTVILRIPLSPEEHPALADRGTPCTANGTAAKPERRFRDRLFRAANSRVLDDASKVWP